MASGVAGLRACRRGAMWAPDAPCSPEGRVAAAVKDAAPPGHLGSPRVRSSRRAEDLVPRGRPPVADVARVLLLPVSVFRTVTEYVQVICKR